MSPETKSVVRSGIGLVGVLVVNAITLLSAETYGTLTGVGILLGAALMTVNFGNGPKWFR